MYTLQNDYSKVSFHPSPHRAEFSVFVVKSLKIYFS